MINKRKWGEKLRYLCTAYAAVYDANESEVTTNSDQHIHYHCDLKFVEKNRTTCVSKNVHVILEQIHVHIIDRSNQLTIYA